MASSPIHTDPHWEIPTDVEVNIADTHERFLDHFKKHREGLRKLQISAYAVHDGDDEPSNHGLIQEMTLTEDPDRSTVGAEYLARIAWTCAADYARKQRVKVSFRFWFLGTLGTKDFREQCRLTFKLEDLDEYFEKRKEARERLEDEDEDEDEVPPVATREQTAPAIRSATEVVIAEGPMPGNGVSANAIAALQQQAFDLARRAYEGPMQSNLRVVHEVRLEQSNTLREIKHSYEAQHRMTMEMTREFFNRLDKRDEAMQQRIQALETRLDEATKANSRQYENLQQLAQQGWRALLDAVKMRMQDINQRDEWSRQLAVDRMSMEPPEAQPSALASAISSGAPVAVAGLAALLRRGDPHSQNADMFDKIAVNLSKRGSGDEDEDEDEEEEEDGEDPVQPPPHEDSVTNGSSWVGQEHGPSAAPGSVAPCPFADEVRALRDKAGTAKIAKLRKAVPSGVAAAFDAACVATDDITAARSIVKVSKHLNANPMLLLQLGDVFSEDEVVALAELGEKAKKLANRARRQRPSRPHPSA